LTLCAPTTLLNNNIVEWRRRRIKTLFRSSITRPAT
jgi:hypothetical protein